MSNIVSGKWLEFELSYTNIEAAPAPSAAPFLSDHYFKYPGNYDELGKYSKQIFLHKLLISIILLIGFLLFI